MYFVHSSPNLNLNVWVQAATDLCHFQHKPLSHPRDLHLPRLFPLFFRPLHPVVLSFDAFASTLQLWADFDMLTSSKAEHVA